jgi:hypothetical protein
MKNIVISIAAMLCLAGIIYAETKYAADATAAGAAVNFKAKSEGWYVKAINAECGASDKDIKVYARKAQALNPQEVTVVVDATCTVVNTGLAINTNDLLIVQHVNGTADYRTATTGTSASQIVLSAAPSVAFAAGMKIYEIEQIGNINMGITNTSGVASKDLAGDALIVTPKDSPLRVLVDGSTNNIVTVTAQ